MAMNTALPGSNARSRVTRRSGTSLLAGPWAMAAVLALATTSAHCAGRPARHLAAEPRPDLLRRPRLRRHRPVRLAGQPHAEPRPDGRRGRPVHRLLRLAAAVCSASRAALLTGCYPNRVGIHGALGPNATASGINDDETTAGRAAQDAQGYATGMVGKWHLGAPPAVPAHAPRVRRVPRPPLLQRHVAAPSRGDRKALSRRCRCSTATRSSTPTSRPRPARSSPTSTPSGPVSSSAATRTGRSSSTSPRHAARPALRLRQVHGQDRARASTAT